MKENIKVIVLIILIILTICSSIGITYLMDNSFVSRISVATFIMFLSVAMIAGFYKIEEWIDEHII